MPCKKDKGIISHDVRVYERNRFVPIFKSKRIRKLQSMGLKAFKRKTKTPRIYGVTMRNGKIIRKRRLK